MMMKGLSVIFLTLTKTLKDIDQWCRYSIVVTWHVVVSTKD